MLILWPPAWKLWFILCTRGEVDVSHPPLAAVMYEHDTGLLISKSDGVCPDWEKNGATGRTRKSLDRQTGMRACTFSQPAKDAAIKHAPLPAKADGGSSDRVDPEESVLETGVYRNSQSSL